MDERGSGRAQGYADSATDVEHMQPVIRRDQAAQMVRLAQDVEEAGSDDADPNAVGQESNIKLVHVIYE